MRGPLRAISSLGLALAAVVFAASCGKAPAPSGSSFLRLIDLLPDAGVRTSPYLGKRPEELTEGLFPVHSHRLADLGAGENGLGLKRKIKLGTNEFNILFAPPSSEYEYETDIPAGAVLDLGMGIVRDEFSEARAREMAPPEPGAGDGVDFLVSIEAAGRRKTLIQKFLELPAVRPERTVNYFRARVELPAQESKVRLILRTTGREGAFAFWANPVLFVPSSSRLNVVLVSIDTLRPDHLGCYGYGRESSPAMDALAKEGVLFEKTYASSPWTLPSHVSMLTGLQSVHHQVYSRDNEIDPGLPTLADRLRANSFFCAATTGGAFLDPMFGFSKGFDEYQVRGGETDRRKLAAERYETVSRWLDANADRPFFLFVHTYQVHSPYISPEPYNSMFLEPGARLKSFDVLADLDGGRGMFRPFPESDRRNIIGLYDGGIRYTDEILIKGILQKLRSLGLYDRTLVILTSDHGEQFYDHGSWNHGNFLYDDALRVPLIIKFPGSRFRGRRVGTSVRLVDLVPTVLDEIGILPEDGAFDGASLLPLLSGRSEPPRRLLADAIEENDDHGPGRIPRRIAISDGRLKVLFDQGFRPDYLKVLTFRPPDRKPIEAFDLIRDPGETTDISAANSEAIRRFRAEIEELFRKAAPRRAKRTAMSDEVESQLRALGYIR